MELALTNILFFPEVGHHGPRDDADQRTRARYVRDESLRDRILHRHTGRLELTLRIIAGFHVGHLQHTPRKSHVIDLDRDDLQGIVTEMMQASTQGMLAIEGWRRALMRHRGKYHFHIAKSIVIH
jgi:hypothetical protein